MIDELVLLIAGFAMLIEVGRGVSRGVGDARVEGALPNGYRVAATPGAI